jgi:hypothetical protein
MSAKKRYTIFILLLVVALVPVTVVAGCGGSGAAGESQNASSADQGVDEGVASSPAPGADRTVTMNGRSVMEGWMKHWGFTREGPVEKNGYSLVYKELDASDLDNLPGSFAQNVEGLAPGSLAFFKFCFVDFQGDNLDRLEGIIDRVEQTAHERGLRLILGNALPVREQDGSPELVDEYRRYNAFLEATAGDAGNAGKVWVYDLYGVLAGPDGFLKPEFQTEDSHPNESAYRALDATFFPLLEKTNEGSGT